MKTLWIDQIIKYDGTQLRSLFAYLDHQVLGNSAVAFRGACDVSFEHMIDGEDLLQQAQICGSDMLHFIFEIFDEKLITGVFVQRLFASIVQNKVQEKSKGNFFLKREGDDLYLNDAKLSISIAAHSPQSILVHFAMNISNKGTPVKTSSLEDLNIEPVEFAKELLKDFSEEYKNIQEATWKVKPVS